MLIVYLVFIATLAQIADLYTALKAMALYGTSPEIGLLGRLYELGGVPLVIFTKLIMIVVVLLLIFNKLKANKNFPINRVRIWRVFLLTVVFLVGIFGTATNLVALAAW